MQVAHLGDTVVGICSCSTPPYPDVGTIVSSSTMDFDFGMGMARLGDSVVFSCGTSVITSSATKHIAMGQPVARLGDSVTGCGNGTIVSVSNAITM